MIKKKDFDNIIRRNIVKNMGDSVLGYDSYENYYSRAEFEKFKTEMQRPEYLDFYNRYKAGKGSELEPQKGKFGEIPPKMVSVASSSRFCYLAFRDMGSGSVKVEVPCRIKGVRGTPPQLDAYISEVNTFFEVKCHEIFDSHSIKLSDSYWNLIYGKNNDFGLSAEKPDGEAFNIPLTEFNITAEASMFDIKQLLCHLLGIASQKDASENIRFVYLFFKPKTDSEDDNRSIDEVFDLLQSEIKKIFNSKPIKKFTSKNNIFLSAIAEFSEVMEPLTKENIIILA